MPQCKKFAPNIFHKTKCSNCFRQKEEHSAEALQCNLASRSVARSGYLFVAPDWDFSVPLNRTKRWQRRWFVLYDDGTLNYSVDEHPDTVPQGSVDMIKVLEVTGAEQITGHPHSLALTGPDRVTFVKAASREDARWWAELLAVFPRRHKRNATFPGGRASPSLPQLGRSTSPQPPRLRHLSYIGPTSRSNFTTSPFKIERDTRNTAPITQVARRHQTPASTWIVKPSSNLAVETSLKTDDITTSNSSPTRDNLEQEDAICVSANRRRERCKDTPATVPDRSQESNVTLPSEDVLHRKKGWLWYKDKNTENEWLRRWWVQSEHTLNAYIDQDEHTCPEITIGLSTITNLVEIATDARYGFQISWSGSTYILSAITSSIRSSWLQTLRKATSVLDSPPAPATPRSCLFSSDEEYRTASEGGRRDSEDWGDLLSSPSFHRIMFAKVRDRTRVKCKLPRNQSRHSTLDSVSTDELDAYKQPEELENKSAINNSAMEINNSVIEINELREQLSVALTEVQRLETELIRCKKLQSESLVREQQTKEIIDKLEKLKKDLRREIQQNEEKCNCDQEALHDRLKESDKLVKKTEEKYLLLIKDFQTKQETVSSLQEKLDCLNERYTNNRLENDRLYKRIQEMECKPHRRKRLDSLTELIDLNTEIDWESLNPSELIEQCLDMRSRLETAVVEIKAMKKELRESHAKYDQLELETVGLRNKLEVVEREAFAQSTLMADRVQDLTVKLATAEKQTRNLKSKLQDSREKRRSLSLKGRENFSINKEIEDKISELEAKMLSLERSRFRRRNRRERSSERASPVDDKSQQRGRRKSLDSATSPEPVKLFMRLHNLDRKLTNVTNSSETLNPSSTTYSDMKTDQIGNKNMYGESVILAALEKLNDCKYAFNLLKTSTNMNVNELTSLENNLSELSFVLNSNTRENEISVIHSSACNIVRQLENILKEKLRSLLDKKRALIKLKQLSDEAKLEILAEKVAYENVIVDRIHQALSMSILNDNNCTRLLLKESIETMSLLCSLNEKLCERRKKQIPKFKTSVDYLTKIVTKRLLIAAHNYTLNKDVEDNLSPILGYLKEEQAKVAALMNTYKLNKLPQLADALALEAISTAADSNVKLLSPDVVDEVWTTARQAVNSELMESEISHVMMRTAQLYEQKSSLDQNYFFTFFAYERVMLELWSNSVETQLQAEMDKNIEELTKMFKYSLSKFQRQHWRKRIELQRSTTDVKLLLTEFADVISHKSLIDARINVLKSEYKLVDKDISNSCVDTFLMYLQSEKHLNCLEDIGLIHTSQSLEAEFKCMLGRHKVESESTLTKFDFIEVRNSLQGLSREILNLLNYCTGKTPEDPVSVINLYDVSNHCEKLRSHLIDIKQNVMHSRIIAKSDVDEEKQTLGTEYLNQVENFRAAYRRTLIKCESPSQQADLEQLQILCEQVLLAMEHWHRKTLQELREQHVHELQTLQSDKEQALAEETQATLAALDAMRKAHEAEVQREVAKFKQDFARKQQDEVLDLTERLSVKCLEAATLEEQLGTATRQLAHAQQHILQLERNPQLSFQN